MVAELYEYIKDYWFVKFKWVSWMTCESYTYKVDVYKLGKVRAFCPFSGVEYFIP